MPPGASATAVAILHTCAAVLVIPAHQIVAAVRAAVAAGQTMPLDNIVPGPVAVKCRRAIFLPYAGRHIIGVDASAFIALAYPPGVVLHTAACIGWARHIRQITQIPAPPVIISRVGFAIPLICFAIPGVQTKTFANFAKAGGVITAVGYGAGGIIVTRNDFPQLFIPGVIFCVHVPIVAFRRISVAYIAVGFTIASTPCQSIGLTYHLSRFAAVAGAGFCLTGIAKTQANAFATGPHA